MGTTKQRLRAWARFAVVCAGSALSVPLGVSCSADRGGDDVGPGTGGSGGSAGSAPIAGAGAGMGVAGMQVTAGGGGVGGGSGGAGGVAGSLTGGVGGVGGAGGIGGAATGGSGGSMAGGSGGMGGASGTGEDGGAIDEPDAATTSDTCAALPDATPPYMPVYRVPLRVHTTRSDLGRDELCGTLEEVNEIWWAQAGVCFEIEIVGDDEIAGEGMDLWFERSSPFPNGTDANGVYAGAHEIYSLDEPSLNTAPNPTEHLPARTAAHELGHGLGLNHQNCGTACNDLLMTSGRRGFALVTGSPASLDEHARARDRAPSLALDDTTKAVCGAPVFRDEP